MADLQEIRPGPEDRMLIVGATGTGKTTLARELLRGYERVLVIDPKCTYDPQDERYQLVVHPGAIKLALKRYPYVRYRAHPRFHSIQAFDTIYRAAYFHRNLMVYTDETALVVRNSQSTPQWLNACIRCGRELRIGMIFASQRPSQIPLPVMTETGHKISFYLASEDDRKRMAHEMGRIVLNDPVEAVRMLEEDEEKRKLAEHAFWRWTSRQRLTRLSVLDLRKRDK